MLLGICTYHSLVRPSVHSHAKALEDARMLEVGWALEASELTAAGAGESTEIETAAEA